MSLINCPHCGQGVSDSAKTCPHCGAVIKEEPKNYYALSLIQQSDLQKEYRSLGGIVPLEYEDMHNKYVGKTYLFVWLMSVFGIMPLILFLALAIGVIPVFYAFAVVFLCVTSIFIFLIIRTNRKYKVNLKKMVTNRVDFEMWLQNTHNIIVFWEWGTATQYYSDYKLLRKQKGLE